MRVRTCWKIKSSIGRTYEKKKAELIQSNNFPDGSPPKTSSGSPCSLALPKFDLSRTMVYVSGMAREKTTETNRRKDTADKQLEGFVHQVFEPTAVPQLPSARNHSAMTLRPQSFRQIVYLAQCQNPYLRRRRKSLVRERDQSKVPFLRIIFISVRWRRRPRITCHRGAWGRGWLSKTKYEIPQDLRLKNTIRGINNLIFARQIFEEFGTWD